MQHDETSFVRLEGQLSMGNSNGFGLPSVSRRMFLASIVAGGIAALVTACGSGNESAPPFNGTDITGAGWGRGFDLTDHTGKRRALADFRDKVVLAFFGYTNCPDACPLALSEMAQVVKQLGRDGDKVQGLFITVDPERDTPERLASYVPAFHPTFIGLRGTEQEIEKVKREFKIYSSAEKPDSGSHSGHGEVQTPYMVNHSTGIYALDKAGRPRLYFSANDRSVEAMVHDVKLLLGRGSR